MKLLLIRHTSVNISKSICYGQTDVPLNDTFEQESALVFSKIEKILEKKAINTEGVTLWSSPLSRAFFLAEKFGKKWGKDISIEPSLKELNFGDWENRAWADIPPEKLDAWMSDFVNISPPNGESFSDLFARATHFLEKLLTQKEKNHIVFTHAGTMRAALAWALDLPLENAFRFDLDYGAVIELTIQGNKAWNKVKF